MPVTVAKIEAEPSKQPLAGFQVVVELRNDGERMLFLNSSIALFMPHPTREFVEVARGEMTQPDMAVELGRMGGRGFIFFRVSLDPWRFQHLEKLRAGGKVKFQFEMSSIVQNIDKAAEFHRMTLRGNFTIERSAWVEDFLPPMELDKIELWEVRFPSEEVHPTLAHERGLLMKALQDYDKGEYEHAYASCRKAIESLGNREQELELSDIIGAEVWKRSKNYLSIAVHAENEITRRIVRADAEFAITTAKAIYKRAADALLLPQDKT